MWVRAGLCTQIFWLWAKAFSIQSHMVHMLWRSITTVMTVTVKQALGMHNHIYFGCVRSILLSDDPTFQRKKWRLSEGGWIVQGRRFRGGGVGNLLLGVWLLSTHSSDSQASVLVFYSIFCTCHPSPKAKGSCLCVCGPGTKVCLISAACLEGDTRECVLLRLLCGLYWSWEPWE